MFNSNRPGSMQGSLICTNEGKLDVDFNRATRYNGGYFHPKSFYTPKLQDDGTAQLLEHFVEIQNKTFGDLRKMIDKLYLDLDKKITDLEVRVAGLDEKIGNPGMSKKALRRGKRGEQVNAINPLIYMDSDPEWETEEEDEEESDPEEGEILTDDDRCSAAPVNADADDGDDRRPPRRPAAPVDGRGTLPCGARCSAAPVRNLQKADFSVQKHGIPDQRFCYETIGQLNVLIDQKSNPKPQRSMIDDLARRWTEGCSMLLDPPGKVTRREVFTNQTVLPWVTIDHYNYEEFVVDAMQAEEGLESEIDLFTEDLLLEMPFAETCRLSGVLRETIRRVVNKEISPRSATIEFALKCDRAIMERMPDKLEDPGHFVLDVTIGPMEFIDCLCDLGAGVNVMPHSAALAIGLTDFKPTKVYLELADHSDRHPLGKLKNIPVMVGDRFIPVDFYVLKMENEETSTRLIFGRSFLATAGAAIDCTSGRITLWKLGSPAPSFRVRRDSYQRDKIMKKAGVFMITRSQAKRRTTEEQRAEAIRERIHSLSTRSDGELIHLIIQMEDAYDRSLGRQTGLPSKRIRLYSNWSSTALICRIIEVEEEGLHLGGFGTPNQPEQPRLSAAPAAGRRPSRRSAAPAARQRRSSTPVAPRHAVTADQRRPSEPNPPSFLHLPRDAPPPPHIYPSSTWLRSEHIEYKLPWPMGKFVTRKQFEDDTEALVKECLEIWPQVRQCHLEPTLRRLAGDLLLGRLSLDEVCKHMSHLCNESIAAEAPQKQADRGPPTLTCMIGYTQFNNVLCDSGAAVNIISATAAQQLGLNNVIREITHLRIGDGSIKATEGVVKSVPLRAQERFFTVDFHILRLSPDLDEHILLGRPFLSTAGAIMNFNTNTVTLTAKNDGHSSVTEHYQRGPPGFKRIQVQDSFNQPKKKARHESSKPRSQGEQSQSQLQEAATSTHEEIAREWSFTPNSQYLQ